jgi:hypothetical protein
MCQYATNSTATYRHTLRLPTFSDVHFHLQSAVTYRRSNSGSSTHSVTVNGLLEPRHCSHDTPNLPIHMASDATPCRRMSGYRRFEGSCCLQPRRQAIQESGDMVSRPTRPESSSLCANVFRAEFHLHTPTNDGLTRRQIYRVHP